METNANRHRQPTLSYKKGDLVWLNMKNVRTERPYKKLDWKNAKFTIQEIVSTHVVRLNTPPSIHLVFHVNLVRLAS